jgi:radical SAM-linked protein
MTALLRTFRRAKLSIPHSHGFHPKPKVSFGPACPVGTESRAEYLDMELFGLLDPGDVAARVRAELPQGFTLLDCAPLDPSSPSLSTSIRGIAYLVELPVEVADAIAGFDGGKIVRERDGKDPIEIDLKKSVVDLRATGPRSLRFTLKSGESEAVARPSELLEHLFGKEHVQPGVARLVREEAFFAT